MTLRAFIFQGQSKPPRGAISRAAEYLDISYNTMHKYLTGEYPIGKSTAKRIAKMIAKRIDLSPCKPPGRPRNSRGFRALKTK